jgi:hypothetical protein
MAITQLCEIEQQIATKVVDTLLEAGYTLSVNDGEETTLKHSTDRAAILDAMGTTDEEYLFAHKDGRTATAWLVYGNGCDLITDCSVSLSDVLQPAQEFADRFQG